MLQDGTTLPDANRSEKTDQVTKTPYEMIGGEVGVRRLVERFYEIMDADPAAANVRAMHAEDLSPMRQLLFEFLSGAFGGPPLYMRRPDAKCIMSAHAHFKIGTAERDQWMMCMRGAIESMDLPDATNRFFEDGFFRMVDAMVNAKEELPADE